jgi:uncharacterized membrane protein YeaQ/YmgE (transglycosylase-associated protein family)
MRSRSWKMKKWINRGGLVAIIAGVIAYAVTGGSVESAGQIVTVTFGLVGAALVLIREVLG